VRVCNTVAGARGARPGSNTRRRFDTYVRNDVIAAAGGSPDHNSSIRTSAATSRSTRLNNNPNSARCLGGPKLTSRPPTTASTGPNARHWTTPADRSPGTSASRDFARAADPRALASISRLRSPHRRDRLPAGSSGGRKRNRRVASKTVTCGDPLRPGLDRRASQIGVRPQDTANGGSPRQQGHVRPSHPSPRHPREYAREQRALTERRRSEEKCTPLAFDPAPR
jgi:hypothetical protein